MGGPESRMSRAQEMMWFRAEVGGKAIFATGVRLAHRQCKIG